MKKTITILAIVLIAFATTTNAQLQRGNVLIGGDLAKFNLGLKKGSTFSMDITPKAAWFIKDNLAIGGLVNLNLQTLGEDNGTFFRYSIDALGRYYVNDPKVNVLRHGRFFFEGNVGVGGQNITDGPSTNGLDLGFGPGYAYFITPNIGLEGLLKYEGFLGFGEAATQSNLTLGVGFQIYLPGRTVKAAATNTQ